MLREIGLRLGVAGLMAGVLLSGSVMAADLDVVPGARPKPAPTTAVPPLATPVPAVSAPVTPAAAASIEQLLAATPDCVEATDRCRVCVVAGGGKPSCSNVGIACEPRNWTCVRKQTAPPPAEPKKDQAK